METNSDILTLDEISKYLKISKSTIYMLTSNSRIPHFKVGKQLRFRKSGIDKWADELESTSKRKRKERQNGS